MGKSLIVLPQSEKVALNLPADDNTSKDFSSDLQAVSKGFI